jgi:hypothetical protein
MTVCFHSIHFFKGKSLGLKSADCGRSYMKFQRYTLFWRNSLSQKCHCIDRWCHFTFSFDDERVMNFWRIHHRRKSMDQIPLCWRVQFHWAKFTAGASVIFMNGGVCKTESVRAMRFSTLLKRVAFKSLPELIVTVLWILHVTSGHSSPVFPTESVNMND